METGVETDWRLCSVLVTQNEIPLCLQSSISERNTRATKWHVVLAIDNMWCNHYAGTCQPLSWLLFWLLIFKPESNQVCLSVCDLLFQTLNSWNIHWVIKCARHCAKCYDKWFGHKQTNPILHHREFMFCWEKMCTQKALLCGRMIFSNCEILRNFRDRKKAPPSQ